MYMYTCMSESWILGAAVAEGSVEPACLQGIGYGNPVGDHFECSGVQKNGVAGGHAAIFLCSYSHAYLRLSFFLIFFGVRLLPMPRCM